MALGHAQAEIAYQAVLSLANAPRQAPAFLRTHVSDSKPPDAKAIAQWLRDLDDDQFEVREKASGELTRLGKSVEAELRRSHAATQSAEVPIVCKSCSQRSVAQR